MNAIRAWLHRWQEPAVWLPLTLIGLAAAYYVLPAIDPRAGVDGFGSVWGMLVNVLAVVLASFFAWLICEVYHYCPRDDDERELIDHACGIDRVEATGKRLGHGLQSWPAVVIFIWNQLLWLVLFAVLLRLFAGR